MSNQSWIRRSSPSSSKSGPLKATLPMSSLTRQNSNLRQHSVDNSPVTLSPTSPWKTRASPDQLLSGIRSPGALNYKGKCHFSRHSIRRTASLDTIYLTGQWPRDFHASLLHLDKATQTEELDGKKGQRYTPDFNAVAEDKLDKMIRHRLLQRQQSNSRDNILQSRPRAMQEHSSQTTTPPPLRSPSRSAAPAHNMRSSTEGLNQEIERLVLRAMSSLGGSEGEEEKAIQITPEGHRAPLPDLLRLTRTVNTQTPSNDLLSPSKHLSPCDKLLSLADKQSPDSPASLSPPLCDTSRHTLSLSANTGRNLSPCGRQLMSSRNLSSTHFSSSPHFVALSPKALDSDESPEAEEMRGLGGGGGGGGGSRSPKINRFLAREPPDGCERVSLKFTEDNSSKDLTALDYSDFKPSATFQLKPSAGSAFLPLSAPNKTPVASPANLSDT